MTTEIKKLDSHHISMVEKTVFESATIRELAAEFGMTVVHIGNLKRSEAWRLKEQDLRKELTERHLGALTQLRGPAIEALKDGVHVDEDINVRLKSAKEILDRTGFAPGQDISRQSSTIINLFIPDHLKDEIVIDTEAVVVKQEKGEKEDA